ncbi:MAG: AAA family ATPase [Desulfuromonadaceae bacterium]|nr:AAA family ATPase [Desulfuromonas sp.]MDY0185213.1 AAA family ATPase [Desulfuromonadaceae bacterium]
MSSLQFFGFEREPFSNAPDSRFYFENNQHKQAQLRIRHVIDSGGGLAVISGGIGSGKTTLARRILDTLAPGAYEASLLVMVHSGVTPSWILTRIAMQLGVKEPAADRMAVLKQLYDRLLEIHTEGRSAVVLIDEAQMLQTSALMEEFRGLLNLEIPGKKLLNLVFFGLPEIEECLRLDEPLAQRVAMRYHLHPLQEQETVDYIRHRLRIAGASYAMFANDAVEEIHKFSAGVPRLINTLGANCLFEAFLNSRRVIDTPTVVRVAGDLGLTSEQINENREGVERHLSKIEELLERLEKRRD